jgi:hypothetical protein
MTPIVCVGETFAERDQGHTHDKVRRQVIEGLSSLDKEQIGQVVVAYEPIWAIGTGKTATADDAQTVCSMIRETIGERFGFGWGQKVRIQYGGSVKAANAAELMAQPDVDGLLVGGASLDADEFARIVKYRMSGLNAVIKAAATGEVPDAVKVVEDMPVPEPSAADTSADWVVNNLALYSASVGEPLSAEDLERLRTPAGEFEEVADERAVLAELNNRVVGLARRAIDDAKQHSGIVHVEVRKGLRIPQDWAYHYQVMTESRQPWLVSAVMFAALNRNLMDGERRDWRSK